MNPITAAQAQSTWIQKSKQQNEAFKELCDRVQTRIVFVCNPAKEENEEEVS